MKRREFVGLLGAAALWPIAARSQQPDRMRRGGVLVNLTEGDLAGSEFVSGFRQALQELGWEDGRNARVDMRWGAGDRDRYRKYATELVALAPDVIFAATTDAVVEVQRASRTVPIVFVGVIDPVGSGLVVSMARPGGNATGFTVFEYAIASKWLELLKEIAPRVTRAAVLRDANTASGIGQFAAIQAVAPVGLELSTIGLRDVHEVEEAITAFARERTAD